tara:strand:+ start:848 stop:1222 length:375 start_codon:yes stop_codon:yes gene_type:complete
MAYVSQELKKELAVGIKKVLKKYKVKGSIAVRHHSTLVVNLKSGAVDFQKDYLSDQKVHYSINPYHYQSHFEGKAKAFLTELEAAIKSDKWFDKSDIMTDYFHTAYYWDVNIGKFNKDYVVEAA